MWDHSIQETLWATLLTVVTIIQCFSTFYRLIWSQLFNQYQRVFAVSELDQQKSHKHCEATATHKESEWLKSFSSLPDRVVRFVYETVCLVHAPQHGLKTKDTHQHFYWQFWDHLLWLTIEALWRLLGLYFWMLLRSRCAESGQHKDNTSHLLERDRTPQSLINNSWGLSLTWLMGYVTYASHPQQKCHLLKWYVPTTRRKQQKQDTFTKDDALHTLSIN